MTGQPTAVRSAPAAPPSEERASHSLPRFIVAILVALAAIWGAYAAYTSMRQPGAFAADFMFPWRAARALLGGDDPYTVIRPTGHFPFDANFKYPLPAAFVAMPFAWLPPVWAGTAFCAASAAVVAYGVARRRPELWPVFVSKPLLSAMALGQLAPLLTAGALLPVLSPLWVAKPTIALALFAAYPSRRAVLGGLALVLIGLAVLPSWPLEWWSAIQGDPQREIYVAPIGVYVGPLLTAAALRWRRPEARLLLVLACTPHTMFLYDELPLFLVARSAKQAGVIALGGWASTVALVLSTRGIHPFEAMRLWGPYIVAWVYLPCLLMVLLRPNEGPVPAWAERLAGRLHQSLRRGRAGVA